MLPSGHHLNSQIHGDGIELSNIHRYPSPSSTRLELCAAIHALYNPMAVHVGIDNLAVVRRLQIMLKPTYAPSQKPWGIIKECDLWEHAERLCISRPSNATTVSKVKGHATEQDVADGVSTFEHKRGNDRADHVVG